MNRKWMPIAAGILEMLAGFVMLASAFSIFTILRMEAPQPWEELSLSFYGLAHLVFGLGWWLLPFVAGLFGIAPLVGGAFALLRRKWGLAIAGAIATVPLLFVAPLGVGPWVHFFFNINQPYLQPFFVVLPLLLSIAIITLLSLSKREFK